MPHKTGAGELLKGSFQTAGSGGAGATASLNTYPQGLSPASEASRASGESEVHGVDAGNAEGRSSACREPAPNRNLVRCAFEYESEEEREGVAAHKVYAAVTERNVGRLMLRRSLAEVVFRDPSLVNDKHALAALFKDLYVRKRVEQPGSSVNLTAYRLLPATRVEVTPHECKGCGAAARSSAAAGVGAPVDHTCRGRTGFCDVMLTLFDGHKFQFLELPQGNQYLSSKYPSKEELAELQSLVQIGVLPRLSLGRVRHKLISLLALRDAEARHLRRAIRENLIARDEARAHGNDHTAAGLTSSIDELREDVAVFETLLKMSTELIDSGVFLLQQPPPLSQPISLHPPRVHHGLLPPGYVALALGLRHDGISAAGPHYPCTQVHVPAQPNLAMPAQPNLGMPAQPNLGMPAQQHRVAALATAAGPVSQPANGQAATGRGDRPENPPTKSSQGRGAQYSRGSAPSDTHLRARDPREEAVQRSAHAVDQLRRPLVEEQQATDLFRRPQRVPVQGRGTHVGSRRPAPLPRDPCAAGAPEEHRARGLPRGTAAGAAKAGDMAQKAAAAATVLAEHAYKQKGKGRDVREDQGAGAFAAHGVAAGRSSRHAEKRSRRHGVEHCANSAATAADVLAHHRSSGWDVMPAGGAAVRNLDVAGPREGCRPTGTGSGTRISSERPVSGWAEKHVDTNSSGPDDGSACRRASGWDVQGDPGRQVHSGVPEQEGEALGIAAWLAARGLDVLPRDQWALEGPQGEAGLLHYAKMWMYRDKSGQVQGPFPQYFLNQWLAKHPHLGGIAVAHRGGDRCCAVGDCSGSGPGDGLGSCSYRTTS